MLPEHSGRGKTHPELASPRGTRNLHAVLDLADEDLRARVAHPGEPELSRFMRGELKGPGLCRVVRHLLTGCPACRRVTRRLWGLGDKVMEPRMTSAEGKKHVRRVLEQMETVYCELLGIESSLPEPPGERVRLQDVSGAATDLRTVIRCVLEDSLRPALRDLREALERGGESSAERRV